MFDAKQAVIVNSWIVRHFGIYAGSCVNET